MSIRYNVYVNGVYKGSNVSFKWKQSDIAIEARNKVGTTNSPIAVEILYGYKSVWV